MRKILSYVAAAALLAAAAGPAVAQKKVTINLLQPIHKSVAFYPQIAGEALGYFAAEGIEINLLPSETTIPYVAFLTNKDADIAMLDAPQTFQAVNAKLPISVIYEVNQLAPEGVVVAGDSPINSVKELHGKTVGLVSDRDLATLKLTMDAVGDNMNDIQTVVVGEAGPTLANAFKRKTVAAIAGALPDWLALEANGIAIKDITPPEMAETPANSFVILSTRKAELDDALKRFMRAWAKGAYVAKVDPAALEMMARKIVPEEWVDEQFGKGFLKGAIRLNYPLTERFGELRPQMWEKVQGQMIKIGEIEQKYDPATFLDPSYIDAANDWDRKKVEADVAAWKKANM